MEQQKLEDAAFKALKDWFKNPTLNNELLDPSIIKQLQDSGQYTNGVKEGIWVEYSLDTSLTGIQTTLVVGDKKILTTFGATLQKEKGIYFNGKRDGFWVLYKSYDKKPPFIWNKIIETNYKNGQKNGQEVLFNLNDTISIKSFTNGQEQGIGKIFDTNYPYKLQQVYKATNGDLWLVKTFFSSGQLQAKYADSIVSGKEYKYFQEYYENGKLKMTGFYNNKEVKCGIWTTYYENGNMEIIFNYNEGNLDGLYNYFHDNGQLWTERVYKDGKLWNVNSNYDRNGKKRDSGTIKNGTGKLNIYNTEGKLTKVYEYKDGIEK